MLRRGHSLCNHAWRSWTNVIKRGGLEGPLRILDKSLRRYFSFPSLDLPGTPSAVFPSSQSCNRDWVFSEEYGSTTITATYSLVQLVSASVLDDIDILSGMKRGISTYVCFYSMLRWGSARQADDPPWSPSIPNLPRASNITRLYIPGLSPNGLTASIKWVLCSTVPYVLLNWPFGGVLILAI